MSLREPKRTLCSCREAARVLGCTMGRVRQMCRDEREDGRPLIWSAKVNERSLVLDLDEVKRLAAARQKARDAGIQPGAPPGGFAPDS